MCPEERFQLETTITDPELVEELRQIPPDQLAERVEVLLHKGLRKLCRLSFLPEYKQSSSFLSSYAQALNRRGGPAKFGIQILSEEPSGDDYPVEMSPEDYDELVMEREDALCKSLSDLGLERSTRARLGRAFEGLVDPISKANIHAHGDVWHDYHGYFPISTILYSDTWRVAVYTPVGFDTRLSRRTFFRYDDHDAIRAHILEIRKQRRDTGLLNQAREAAVERLQGLAGFEDLEVARHQNGARLACRKRGKDFLAHLKFTEDNSLELKKVTVKYPDGTPFDPEVLRSLVDSISNL